MNPLKVIITGTTGMVGEGVLLTCLADPRVSDVLSVSRRSTEISHPKLKEYIVGDFLKLKNGDERLQGYDACFFCAGVSSLGKSEEEYTRITYDTTLHFAGILSALNPQMTFIYVSGTGTNANGRSMWARVKGKTENDLLRLPFKSVHNFRPGFMKAVDGQKHVLSMYKYIAWMFPVFRRIFPNMVSTLTQVGQAMIICAHTDKGKPVMEVRDINSMS